MICVEDLITSNVYAPKFIDALNMDKMLSWALPYKNEFGGDED